jgi:class 3 adenylate cyclase/tetratricopeptide (TPR) repeat protein
MAMDITEWLNSLSLGVYAEAFSQNHIEAETLPSLTMEDLREMGVTSVGHRRRILAGIPSLSQTETQPVPRVAPADEELGSERRQVTVLFADIADFTALSTDLDAEQVHALLSVFFEQVDRIIADFGGRIDKHIGDCAMAVFGAPVAHSDDVRRAIASALAIHAAMPKVSEAAGRTIAAHVGISSGEVVASRTGSSRYTEYTVTGETVNLASRLTGLARDGETIASADIVTTLAESVDAEFGGSQSIKGLAAPVNVWRVRGLKDSASIHRPLIGRRAELAQCIAALEAARDGETGSILYVRGEPGIGKSSLAAETLREAKELGFAATRTTVFDFGTGLDREPLRALALALVRKLTRQTAVTDAMATFASEGALAETEIVATKDLLGLELSADDRRLIDAMNPATRLAARGEALAKLTVTTGQKAPLLVVIEDVHWAEAVTLQGLAAMAAKCTAGPTVLLMTSRIDGDPIAILQPLMRGPPLVLIELGRLRDRDARILATAFLGSANPLVEHCIARAGGNPLFLEQLIRHASSGGLASSIPGSIRSVVTAQIDQLAAPEKTALQAAAVLGNQFSIDALRHLLDRPEWNPEALIGNRLVHPEKDAFHFTHALIRDGAYASILNPERRRLHRAAAGWFAGHDSALRAEHLGKAEDPEAVAAYITAAEEQLARYRVEEALDLLARAGAIAREPGERFSVKVQEGNLLTELGRSAEAVAAYDLALELAEDDKASALAMLGKAGTLRLLERNREAIELLLKAEPVFAAENRLAELARLEHLRGNLYFPLAETEACRTAHARALDYAERSGSVELKARALGGLGDAAYATGRFVTAERHFAECIDLCRQHGFGRIEVANAAMHAALASDTETALTEIDRAIATASSAHQPRAEITGHIIAMTLLLWCARPEAVEQHFTRAQALVQPIGARRLEATLLTCMGEAYRQMGDRTRAATLHENALAIVRDVGMSYNGAIVLGHRALLAHDDDKLRRESLSEGERALSGAVVSHNAYYFYSFAIESCLLAEDWREARRLAGCFGERFTAEKVPMIEFQIDRGRLLSELGEHGPTSSLLQALEKCREVGRKLGYRLFLRLLDRALETAGSVTSHVPLA